MKRIIFTLFLLLSVAFVANAQMKVVINKSSGGDDTYPFNESTKITFNGGDIKFSTPSMSNVYTPREIKNVVFGANVSSITLSQTSANVEVGGRFTLTVIFSPANATNCEITWSSDDEDVAMVSSKGIVVGLKEGTANITAETSDGSGVKASCTVNVIPIQVKSITLNHDVYALSKGETITLLATILPENAANKEVSWTSSNNDVVMVNKSGKVVYMGDGEAIVTATAKDGSGISASCIFTCIDGIISVYDSDGTINVYDTNGIILSNTKRGVNIIKMRDGTIKKVIIK